jgi:hypothetical protein
MRFQVLFCISFISRDVREMHDEPEAQDERELGRPIRACRAGLARLAHKHG